MSGFHRREKVVGGALSDVIVPALSVSACVWFHSHSSGQYLDLSSTIVRSSASRYACAIAAIQRPAHALSLDVLCALQNLSSMPINVRLHRPAYACALFAGNLHHHSHEASCAYLQSKLLRGRALALYLVKRCQPRSPPGKSCCCLKSAPEEFVRLQSLPDATSGLERARANCSTIEIGYTTTRKIMTRERARHSLHFALAPPLSSE